MSKTCRYANCLVHSFTLIVEPLNGSFTNESDNVQVGFQKPFAQYVILSIIKGVKSGSSITCCPSVVPLTSCGYRVSFSCVCVCFIKNL